MENTKMTADELPELDFMYIPRGSFNAQEHNNEKEDIDVYTKKSVKARETAIAERLKQIEYKLQETKIPVCGLILVDVWNLRQELTRVK